MHEPRDTPPEWNSAPSFKDSILKLTAPRPGSLAGMGIAGKGHIGNITEAPSGSRAQSFVSPVCRFLHLFYFFLPTGSRFAPLRGSSNVYCWISVYLNNLKLTAWLVVFFLTIESQFFSCSFLFPLSIHPLNNLGFLWQTVTEHLCVLWTGSASRTVLLFPGLRLHGSICFLCLLVPPSHPHSPMK